MISIEKNKYFQGKMNKKCLGPSQFNFLLP